MLGSPVDCTIEWLQTLPFLALTAILVIICFVSILLLMRFFSKSGLYIYVVVAVLVSNIQVLKMTEADFFNQPITLGSMVFTTSFLATVILAEYFGKKAAHKAIWLGFISYFLVSLMMILTLGFKPVDIKPGFEEYLWARESHDHLYCIFSPAPRLFIAGLIAYIIGQYCNVGFFSFVRKLLPGDRWLWLGNFSAMMLSALVDDVAYSFSAWYLLPEVPLSLNIILYSMIIPSYIIRLTVNTLSIPIVYLARYFLPKPQKIEQ